MANSGLIFYIGKLIYPKYDPVWFVRFMYFKYLSIVKRSQTYFIKSLSDKIMWNLIRTIPWSNCDINNCVIVNHEQIYPSDKILELYINNDYYYKIKPRKVVVIPNEYCDKNVVFISNTLYSNYIKNYNKNGNIEQVKLHKKIQSDLDFAQEIELARINTPIDINNATIDHLIKSYFKKPKLIYQNDIITINVKDFDEPLFYSNVKFEMVYFKCLKVRYKDSEIIGGLYCAIGETSIKQCPNIQSFIPKISEIAPCKRNQMYMENFVNISMCPYGLKNYFNSLYESVTPFLEMNDELEDLFPVFLVQGAEGSGADILINALAQKLGMHHFKIHNSDLNANVYSQNESKLVNVFFRAKLSSPCIISIDKFENFGKNNEGQYDARLISSFAQELEKLFFENNNNQFPIILFCCSCTNSNKEQIPADLKRLFLEIIEINAPNDTERVQLLKWIIERNNLKSEDDINLENIANKTHGFYFEDLKALIYYAELNSAKRDEENMDIFLNDVDFEDAIDFMQSNYNQSLGAPKVPKIKWSDVGGLNEVKSEIIKTINLPLQHPELFEKSGLSRSGILLFGPPGTGKTLLAKAVATECNLCFLTVKGPELLNMYVGQSERNVREVFEKARQASPCIIFFDELDSLAPNRGLSGDSGGVMDRVVSQLLAEMDGIDGSASGKIFIIGATNRPDLIDPALLRPGRFDKLLFVGPCSDAESKSSVLEALTKKFRFSEKINLRSIVEKCPKYITGADFYGICSSAWFSAAKRLIERIEQEAGNPEEYSEADVEVAEIDFLEALQNVKPSINEEDMRYFENLRNNFNK